MKAWLIEVALKKMGPSAIRGAILGAFGWLLTRQDMLAPFGIMSDATAHTTIIDWDKLNAAVIVALPALIAAVIKMVNHHADQIVTPPAVEPKP